MSSPTELAALHSALRFGAGITIALIISELMGWQPSFLAPVLLATLLANLSKSPPLNMGLMLMAAVVAAASVAFLLPSLLRGTPFVLFGAIGLILFLAFTSIAQGRQQLPATLLLLCISTVPVFAMMFPAQAGVLPLALVRALAVAIVVLWCMYAIWPRVAARPAPPVKAPLVSPVTKALMATAVVLPLMLIYLLYGITDALPVLVTTVLIVANFDVEQGAAFGFASILGNLIGGLFGVIVYSLSLLVPSLFVLGLLTFAATTAFGVRVNRGGPAGAIALISCNSMLIILSLSILSGPEASGIWLTRLFQFGLAGTFAIGMMSLVWRRKEPAG